MSMDIEFILSQVKLHLGKLHEVTEKRILEIFPSLSIEDLSNVIEVLEDKDYLIISDDQEIVFNEPEEYQDDVLIDDSNYRNIKNNQLCIMYQNGDEYALTVLIKKNMRFVWKAAFHYYKRFRPKLEVEDLYQAGIIGLIKGANRYDYSLGNEFLTYAGHWINQNITRYIADEVFIIRIPVHAFEKIMKIMRLEYVNINDGVDNETIKRIVDDTGFTINEVKDYLNYYKNILTITSFDVPIGEDGDTNLVDYIEDNKLISPQEYAEKQFLRIAIDDCLGCLTEREEKIIRLRFGLTNGRSYTLEDIGKVFNITRERVRQIEAKALRRLKHPSRSRGLREYYYSETKERSK